MSRRPTSPARRNRTPEPEAQDRKDAGPASGGAAGGKGRAPGRRARPVPPTARESGRATPGASAVRARRRAMRAPRTDAGSARGEPVRRQAEAVRAGSPAGGPPRASVPVVSTSFMRRFSDRAREQRRRLRIRTVLIGTALVAVLALLAWVVLASPLLVVRNVDVTGTKRLSASQVREVVAGSRGHPLARVDVDGLAAAVAHLRGVRSAEVDRGWPSTLVVHVTERVPLAAVPVGDAFQVVDSDGVVLETVAEVPDGLPQVEVDVQSAGGRTVQEVVAVLHALSPGLRRHVTTAGATSRDSVSLHLAGGATVVWGSAEDSPRKLKILQALLATHAKVYDVSAPDLPVTRATLDEPAASS